MKSNYKNLGKVCLTPAGYWDRNKKFERIDVVTDFITGRTYIAKQDVPEGISIENQEYWQPIISGGYKNNNIIILSDIDTNTHKLIRYTIQTAIAAINDADKRPGLVLGFYGDNLTNSGEDGNWYLYQFNSDTIDNWNKLDYWVSIYDNIDKFKGYYLNERLLIDIVPYPQIGDYAFVGDSMAVAILYVCIEENNWENTQTSAFAFADKYQAIYSRNFEEFDVHIDETYADRTTKDAMGNIIHDTYITKNGLKNAIIEEVTKAIWSADLPDNIVCMEHLSEAVKQFAGSLGNIVNAADDEDLMIKDNLLKFNDKEYSEHTYSGYGRIFIRKNMIDGVNVLEQYQFNKPNTRYIIQYFHCLDGKTVEVPNHCILDFTAGGWLRNGTLICNNTLIIAPKPEDIAVKLEGTYKFFGLDNTIREDIRNIYERLENIERTVAELTQ